jgi:hypothetical protein
LLFINYNSIINITDECDSTDANNIQEMATIQHSDVVEEIAFLTENVNDWDKIENCWRKTQIYRTQLIEISKKNVFKEFFNKFPCLKEIKSLKLVR